MNKKSWLIFVLIILVAAALRFYNPTFRSLWGDEVDSLFRTYNFAAHNFNYQKVALGERITAAVVVPLSGGHLPAYYVLLAIWTQFFGVGEYTLRLLSILLGILAVPFIYILSKELFDKRVALFSAVLLAVSSEAVFYSQEVRPYSLMLLFSIFSTWFFWRLFCGKKDTMTLIAYVFASCILSLAHLFGVLIIASQFVFLLFSRRAFKEIAVLILMQVIIGILILPFYLKAVFLGLPLMLTMGADFPFSQIPFYLKIALTLFSFSVGESVAPWNFMIVFPAALVFGYLFLKILGSWKDKRILCLLVLCLFPILFSSIFAKVTMPKYLIGCLPFYLILVSCALVQVSSIRRRLVLIFVLVFFQIFSIANYFGMKEYHNANQLEPWRIISRQIKNDYQKGDLILVSTYDILYRVLNYYMNIETGGNYPVGIISFDSSGKIGPIQDENYPTRIIDLNNLVRLKNKRIWLVTHIRDERKVPAGAIDQLLRMMEKKRRMVFEKNYVPYKDTLVSKLPMIKRQNLGSSRITLRLFVIK